MGTFGLSDPPLPPAPEDIRDITTSLAFDKLLFVLGPVPEYRLRVRCVV